MSKRTPIRLTQGAARFNYRIAGLGFRDGHVLVHRAVHEPFWIFPGGRAEIGGTSEETLIGNSAGISPFSHMKLSTASKMATTISNSNGCRQRARP